MAGIPSQLSAQLRQALIECEQFETNRSLRAVFAHEWLRPWRNSLPQADTLSGRVDAVIGFLHNKRRRDGANALVLLLNVLSSSIDPEDERHHQLLALSRELERAFGDEMPSVGSTQEAHPAGGMMTYVAVDEKLLACAKAVGLVSVPKISDGHMERIITGTGWLVTPDLILTCCHVVQVRTRRDGPISEADLYEQAENSLLIFDHTQPDKGVEYGVQCLEHYNKRLDYAVLRLKDRATAPLVERGFLRLDPDPPLNSQTQLFVLQHPRGQVQQRSAGRYAKSTFSGNRILYTTPTDAGASGAPVLMVPSWKAVAVHNSENQIERLREGTLIRSILQDLADYRSRLQQEIMDLQNGTK
jgi:hypothetical protein